MSESAPGSGEERERQGFHASTAEMAAVVERVAMLEARVEELSAALWAGGRVATPQPDVKGFASELVPGVTAFAMPHTTETQNDSTGTLKGVWSDTTLGHDAVEAPAASEAASTRKDVAPARRQERDRFDKWKFIKSMASSQRARAKTTTGWEESIETTVGGHWFAVGGGLALVVALGLFLKLAVNEGWLGAVPPLWRCIAGVLMGGLMMGAGERERVRGRRWTAAGLSGAGIAAAYLSVLAAYGMYGLLDAGYGFAALAAVSAVGVLVAARADLPSVAGVAYTGALLAPVLVRTESQSQWVWPVYLLVLLASAQALSVWKERSFVLVAAGVWAGCASLGALWLLGSVPQPAPVVGFTFIAVGWAIVQAGGLLTLLRRPLASVPSWEWSTLVGVSIATGFGVAWVADRFMRVSTLQPVWLPQAVLLTATLMMVLGVSRVAGVMRAARVRPETDTDRFMGALLVQAAAFAISTIVLATSSATGAAVLALSAVAAAGAGRLTRALGLEAYAFVLLIAAVVESLWGFQSDSSYSEGSVVLGLVPSTWMLVAVLTGLSGLAVAWLYMGPPERRTSDGAAPGWAAWVMGVVMLMASVANGSAEVRSMQVAWLAIAWSLLTWRGLALRVPAVGSAMLVTLATAALWCGKGVGFSESYWIENENLLPVLNGGLLVGLAIAGAFMFASRRVGIRSMVQLLCGIALFWMLIVTTLEVVRVAPAWTADRTCITAAVSIWWAVFAAGLVGAGFALRVPPVRHAGLALMAFVAAKVVLFDLADVALAWRIISFVALGVLMLAVAGAYARLPNGTRKDRDQRVRSG